MENQPDTYQQQNKPKLPKYFWIIFSSVIAIIIVVSAILIIQIKTATQKKAQLQTVTQALTAKLLQANKQYTIVSGKQKEKKLQEMVTIAIQRKKELTKLIQTSPEVVLQQALQDETRKELPDEIQPYIEKEVSAKGKLTIIHGDDFENNKSYYDYVLNSKLTKAPNENLEEIHLHFTSPQSALTTGSSIEVKGFALDKDLVVNQVTQQVKGISTKEVLQATTTNLRVAVILVKFADAIAQPRFTREEVQTGVLTATNSVKNFFETSSYGQVSFSADILGWYTIPAPSPDPNFDNKCFILGIVQPAEAAATAAGINLAGYDKKLFVHDLNGQTGCVAYPDGNSAFTGGNVATTYGTNFSRNDTHKPIHELGHLLNLYHANRLYCGSVAIDSDDRCSSIAYGDPTDVMGAGINADFNAPHKFRLGWIPPTKVRSISEQGQDPGGLYTVSPLGSANSQTLAIQLVTNSNRRYYISYRQPVGLDVNLTNSLTKGVSIHREQFQNTGDTVIIATDPNEGVFGTALADYETFNNPIDGFFVEQRHHDSTSATVQITFPGFPPPTSSPSPTSTPSPTLTPSPTPQPCTINSAQWGLVGNSTVVEGTQVQLNTQASGDCSGKQVEFRVWEDDGLLGRDAVRINPSAASLNNAPGNSSFTATTSWIAEYQPDCLIAGNPTCDPPEYYFEANIAGQPQALRSNTPLLLVNKLPVATPTPTPTPSPTPSPTPANTIEVNFGIQANNNLPPRGSSIKNIEPVTVDGEAIYYATFQSHNQKVVSNQYGYFITYLHHDSSCSVNNYNLCNDINIWRLARSRDGGATFTTIYEETANTRAPVIETDYKGNIYLMRANNMTGQNQPTEFYKFSASALNSQNQTIAPEIKTAISTLPTNSGKYAMEINNPSGEIYYFTLPGWFVVLNFDGTVKTESFLLTRDGPFAGMHYPYLYLDERGILYAAWTTVKNNAYRSIHFIKSEDGGRSWKKAGGGSTFLLPIPADETGPSDMVSLKDEFNSSPWLSTFIVKGGMAHFMYAAAVRQHYTRFNLAEGRIDINTYPLFQGETVSVGSQDGFCATKQSTSQIFCVNKVRGQNALAILRSDDNGVTWHGHAKAPVTDYKIYSIGGSPKITDDGYIIGTYTDGLDFCASDTTPCSAPKRVRFFKVPIQ